MNCHVGLLNFFELAVLYQTQEHCSWSLSISAWRFQCLGIHSTSNEAWPYSILWENLVRTNDNLERTIILSYPVRLRSWDPNTFATICKRSSLRYLQKVSGLRVKTLKEDKWTPTATLQIAVVDVWRGAIRFSRWLLGTHDPFWCKMYPLMPGIFQRQWQQLVSAAQSEPSFWAKRSNLARVLAVERRGCHLLTLRGLIKACSKQSVVAMLSTSAPTKCTAPSAEDWGSGVLQVVLPETGRLAAAAERRASTAAVESKEISLAKKSVASMAFEVDVSMSSLDTLATERYSWKLILSNISMLLCYDMLCYIHLYAIYVPGSGSPPPHPFHGHKL